MERDQQDAVDVAAGQVVLGTGRVPAPLRHQQDELQVARPQLAADAAQEAREERIDEQSRGGLGDDHADRFAAPGHEAPGSPVGDVAEAGDLSLDAPADVRADLGGAVDDARDGRAGNAGGVRDLLEGCAGTRVATVDLRHCRWVPSCRD